MKYHLIGSLGVSMQAIGILLEKSGHSVTGSDLKLNGHDKKNITPDIDCVIYTSAISRGSAGYIEIEEAKKLGIKTLKRSQFLAELTHDKYLITISGMHGKTTVTALCGLTLIEAGLDPTVLIGEKIREFDNQAIKIGKSKYFVLEACEYDRSFLDLNPDIAILTNIDLEHLDTFPGGMDEIKSAFTNFISRVKKDGAVIAYGGDKNLAEIVSKSRPDIKKIFYGDNIDRINNQMSLFGRHNKINAQAAYALAKYLKIDDKFVNNVLKDFRGAKRRLEYKGKFGRALVYDDYGHHPTEIAVTIKALKDKYPDKKILTIFWPHQYKRILPLFDQFVEALSLADEIILKPIFLVPGRDEKLNISSDQIADELIKLKKKSRVLGEDHQIVEYLESIDKSDMVILTIGIPPIYKVANLITEEAK